MYCGFLSHVYVDENMSSSVSLQLRIVFDRIIPGTTINYTAEGYADKWRLGRERVERFAGLIFL